MIYVYCPRASHGVEVLVEALNDLNCPARSTRGRLLERVRPQDLVVSWGASCETPVVTLNNVPGVNKYRELVTLRDAGVAALEASRTPQEGFIGRRWRHQGGRDILRPTRPPQFWTRKLDLVEEYRIHSFRGLSVRAGHKVGREGVEPHPWIRSLDAGWRIQYDGFKSRRAMRELAASAVSALGLQFGAVDMGRLADRSLVVLEVNRAPGMEGGTVEAYAEHIKRWKEGV